MSLSPTLPRPSVCSAACSPCGEQRANVGLNLKFNKKNEEVPGYTKRTEKEWLYSLAVEELLAEYLERFNRTKSTLTALNSFVIETFGQNWKICICLLLFPLSLLDFLKSLTRCPETATMIFSMRTTSGLDWTRMGKTKLLWLLCIRLLHLLSSAWDLEEKGKK